MTITCTFESRVILCGEVRCHSLLGNEKGLRLIALTIRSLSDLELKIKISHKKHYMQAHNIKSRKSICFLIFSRNATKNS